MDLDKIVKEITKQVKENKDYAPLVGALVGFLLSADKENKDKILNSLVGAGLGYVAKSLIEKTNKED